MPNHCANILRVRGLQAELEEFRKFATGNGGDWDGKKSSDENSKPLDLNQFVPIPTEILNAKNPDRPNSDAYNSGGFEWVYKNWGTKWGCYGITVEQTKGQLRYDFQTAWSPFGQPVLAAMSKKFPSLEFELKFAERGCEFSGIWEARDGVVTIAFEGSAKDGENYDGEMTELVNKSG